MVKFGWDKLKRFLAQANTWTGVQTFSSLVATTADINAGTIDATTVGATTPAAGTFTGLLGNGVYIAVSTDLAITAAQMKGQTFVCAGTNSPVLPAAAEGLCGSFIAATAAVFSVDTNATPGTDIFVLAGTAQAAGEKITSDGTIYDEVYIECKIAGKWIATPVQGLFVNGG